MAFNENLLGLFEEAFRGEARITKVSPDLRGKIICLYGTNSLGKSKQASRLPNPVFLSAEPGLNGVNGAMCLKVTGWSDFTKHVKTLSSRKFKQVLDSGEVITLILDGADSLAKYCQDYICSQYDVKDISEGNSRSDIPNLYSLYEKTFWKGVTDLSNLGFTIVFISHEAEEKVKGRGTGYFDLAGDVRAIKPIKDLCDIIVHLVSNGVDENNKTIPSTAWFVDNGEAFARTRFEDMVTHIEEFTAENLTKAIIDGINKQNEREGMSEEVTFKDQVALYKDEEDFESVKEEIKNIYIKLEDMNDDSLLDKYDEIVSEVIGDKPVSECTAKQYEALKMIRNNLNDFVDTL